jgi:isopentenyl-diphosphate delta-isomerase
MSDISSRKNDHLDLCATGDVAFRGKTTLFEEVELIHDALPELDLDAIDTTTTILGKRLRAPILIAAMTGGTERAREVNRELARIAEERGYGFGLGSQRAMLKAAARGERDTTYMVREVAPTTLILGNIGGVQARAMSTAEVAELAAEVGADALCVHLNPAQEAVQPEGDRDFRGVLAAIERLVEELPIPVVAKETGCGIGARTAAALAKVGVKHVDVSGAGGTSWVAVETARAEGTQRALGELLRDWGVPTAASVVNARAARPKLATIIATGGVSSGLDVARAIALGAHAAGIARFVLQAFVEGGRAGAERYLDGIEAALRATMLLTGSADLRALRKAPRILGPRLAAWAPRS